ncbi:MAG: hypothetical protein ACR2GJ_07400 [Gemmatimonadaceae bacterium]
MSRRSLVRGLALCAGLVSCTSPRGGRPIIAPAELRVDDVLPTGGYRGVFNNHDQGHADFCVRLRNPSVALRYADGNSSGFLLTEENLEPANDGGGVWCPERGMARLDAREFVPGAGGGTMLFHRGGWGFAGHDPGSAVHYGHLLASDIDSVGVRFVRSDSVARIPGRPRGNWVSAPTAPWPGKGQQDGNGSACAAPSSRAYKVAVRSIPGDMNYLNSAQTATIPYAIYGSPSTDLGPAADRARRIRYTILQWSWINTRGGGVARALVKDGGKFFPCADVPPIVLASVSDAETKTRTGWVQAMYGAIPTGGGGLLYGWIVSAHRHGNEAVVMHLTK